MMYLKFTRFLITGCIPVSNPTFSAYLSGRGGCCPASSLLYVWMRPRNPRYIPRKLSGPLRQTGSLVILASSKDREKLPCPYLVEKSQKHSQAVFPYDLPSLLSIIPRLSPWVGRMELTDLPDLLACPFCGLNREETTLQCLSLWPLVTCLQLYYACACSIHWIPPSSVLPFN